MKTLTPTDKIKIGLLLAVAALLVLAFALGVGGLLQAERDIDDRGQPASAVSAAR